MAEDESYPLILRLEQSLASAEDLEKLSENINPILRRIVEMRTGPVPGIMAKEHIKFGLDFSKSSGA